MKTSFKTATQMRGLLKNASGCARRSVLLQLATVALGLFVVTGCQSSKVSEAPLADSQYADAITLREGDVVKITFPGASNLDSSQPIRRDGKIVLTIGGEIKAAGLTPSELEKEILKQAGPQLVSKEVTVTIESSAYPVFITGAVVHPGKIMTDHQITALEAVMEAGGFDYSKANLTNVRIIRHENGQVKNYTVNLKEAFDGQSSKPFYLKPSDILYVATKFQWL